MNTVILGLDGATWRVLDPLIDDGLLPNIEALTEVGYSGTLSSTFPPVTAPAWLSMATGKNPGQTGVFYYLNRKHPDSFEYETFGSEKYQGESLWEVLNASNDSMGIFNFPMLYPPYEIDGYMVSGLGSPEDETITYPPSLKDELDEVTDGYKINVPYADPKYSDAPEELAADLLDALEQREKAMLYLLNNKDVDVFFGVISATDWAQHYFWKYHDDDHLLSTPEGRTAHGEILTNIWKRADETVGAVKTFADENDAQLMIVSDHGFGKVERTFYLNEWLEQQGFRQSDTSVQSYRAQYFPYIKKVGEAVVSVVPQLNDVATSMGKKIKGTPEDSLDWENSIAYAPKHNVTCGMVHLLSDDPRDEEQVKTALEGLKDDYGLDVNVHTREELYSGENVELAPELLFEINNFECAVDPRHTTDNEVLKERPPHPARNGGHNTNGIFLFAGDSFRPGSGDTASLLDIAPTVLYLLGAPIPEEIDGTVLTEAFEDEFREKTSATVVPEAEIHGETQKAKGRDDLEDVKERLGDLGYI